jgi:hypothetical protein
MLAMDHAARGCPGLAREAQIGAGNLARIAENK